MNFNASDFEKLVQLLPETCIEFLQDKDANSSMLLDFLSTQKLWNTVLEAVQNEFLGQFYVVLEIFILCLLCAVFCALVSDSGLKQISAVVSFVSTSVCLGTVITPTCQMLQEVCDTLLQGCTFLGAFAPAYGAAAAASGHPTSASMYTTMSVLAVQVLTYICSAIIRPVLLCFLCLAIAGCLYDELSLSGILTSCKNLMMWLISGAIILFNGVLSVQTFVSKPSDTLALKTGKTVITTLIPVVGSAVSDAFTTIYGGMGAVQSAVGVFGIISVCLMFLPVFLHCLFFRLSLWFCDIVCGLLQVPTARKCMQGCAAVLDILIALTGGFLCLFIISCMLLTGG